MKRSASTYWNNRGKHQAANDRLAAKLVPASGPAQTMRGELLRAATKLYYDRNNNGFCNLYIGSYVAGCYGVLCIHSDDFCRTKAERESWRRASAAISKHIEAANGGAYIGDDFPDADFERVIDAVIVHVDRLDREAGSQPTELSEAIFAIDNDTTD